MQCGIYLCACSVSCVSVSVHAQAEIHKERVPQTYIF